MNWNEIPQTEVHLSLLLLVSFKSERDKKTNNDRCAVYSTYYYLPFGIIIFFQLKLTIPNWNSFIILQREVERAHCHHPQPPVSFVGEARRGEQHFRAFPFVNPLDLIPSPLDFSPLTKLGYLLECPRIITTNTMNRTRTVLIIVFIWSQ